MPVNPFMPFGTRADRPGNHFQASIYVHVSALHCEWTSVYRTAQYESSTVRSHVQKRSVGLISQFAKPVYNGYSLTELIKAALPWGISLQRELLRAHRTDWHNLCSRMST